MKRLWRTDMSDILEENVGSIHSTDEFAKFFNDNVDSMHATKASMSDVSA